MIEFQLAGYHLDGVLGRGGNGVVCSGYDTETGTPVAVKFLRAGREHKRHAFFSEAQALARLNHAGIVRIIDLGLTDSTPFDASPETPYIVMERIEGVPLQSCIGRLTAAGVVGITERLLETLSYAHARGIVHRDVKPGNILVRPELERVWLVDFGLAFGLSFGLDESGEAPVRVEGTPDYMAPEQIKSSSREIGPWTDLYALGCVLWRAATGDSPHASKNEHDTLLAHLTGQLPEYVPTLDLPTGFERWLRRLLAPNPYSRYERAADARAALVALDTPSGAWLRPGSDPADRPDSNTVVSESAPTQEFSPADRASSTSAIPPEITSAPFPTDWRLVEPRNPASFRAAADLRLFALREIESVGRLDARDAFWSSLGDVLETNRPSLGVLHGDYGMGKTRLARWLAERSHEVGAADTVTIRHDQRDSQDSGLVSLASQILRCRGLEGDELRDWNWKELERLGIEGPIGAHIGMAMQQLLDDDADRIEAPRRLSRQELLEALVTVVQVASSRRGLVIVADDVHHSEQTARLLERLVEGSDGFPIFIVATLDGADGQVGETDLFKLARQHRGPVMELGRMSDEEMTELIDALLAPDEHTTQSIIANADGSPLFAVELVRKWWERGALVATAGKRPRLKTDAPPVPKALHEIWHTRVAAAIESVGAARDEAWRALELAVALGSEVSNDEWARAARGAGMELDRAVLRELIRREIVIATPDGWRFAHPLLRESLATRSREAGRWQQHHAECLRMLEAAGSTDRRVSARKAHHARQSGQREDALDLHFQAFRDVRAYGELDEARRLRREHEALCDELQLGPESEHRVIQMLMNVSVGNQHPQTGDRLGWLVEIAQLSRKHGYDHLLAPASRGLARYELSIGNDREALELYQESISALGEDGDPVDEMYARLQMGSTLHRLGHKDRALASLYRGLDIAKRLSPMWEARALNEIGQVALLMDRFSDARQMAATGRSLTEEVENVRMKTLMVTLQGDIEREDREWGSARAFYEELPPANARYMSEFGALQEWKVALLDLAEGDGSALARFREARGDEPRGPVDVAVDLVFGDPADAAAARLDMAEHDERWMLFDIDARFVMGLYRD